MDKTRNTVTMDVSNFRKDKRKVVFLAFILLSLLLFIVYNVMDRLQDLTKCPVNFPVNGENSNIQRFSVSSSRNVKTQKRLPDVIIVGVKKSGTVTLAQFLNYHPFIAAVGEVSFFEKGNFFPLQFVFLFFVIFKPLITIYFIYIYRISSTTFYNILIL